jgi:gliding motility-associated-like protein
MLTRKLILILAMMHCLASSAQQYNNWYFGNSAGISFNPGGITTPHALTDGTNAANEGNSSISDENGNILFYTNGRTVYNRLHQVMLNGDGLNGHPSAVQTAVIVPMPGNDSIFYVFTTDAIEDAFANGYCYSIVNMLHDNGKGEVVTKNILLSSSCTERLAVVRHGNGTDAWVIGNERSSSVFKAWLLTCNGLQTSPVVSNVGTVLNSYGEQDMGMLKASPDAKKICQTHFPNFDGIYPENFFQIFDFDSFTGALSNPFLIRETGTNYHECEFSPDSKLLYVSRVYDALIDQFEVTLGSAAAVIASRVAIPAVQGIYGTQLGPDEKIYLNRYQSSLSVISSPNVKGPGCRFELNKIDLLGNIGVLGLPSMINDGPVDPYNYFSVTIIDSCHGDVQFNGFTDLQGTVQWSWDFGDGNTASIQNPFHHFSTASSPYRVKLVIRSSASCAVLRKTKWIPAGGIYAHADFDIQAHCDSGFVQFLNKSVFYPDSTGRFIWNFGDGTQSNVKDPQHVYASPGLYSIKLKIELTPVCLNDSMSHDLDLQILSIQAGPDQVIDVGQSAQLSVTGAGTSFDWTPPTALDNAHSSHPLAQPQEDITYTITVRNDAGCKAIDSVHVHVKVPIGIYMPNAFTPNNDGLNDLIKPYIGPHFSLTRFSIYNRWGQPVFSTNVKGKGWDGKSAGVVQPAGGYVWFINAKDDTGRKIEKEGVLVLVR